MGEVIDSEYLNKEQWEWPIYPEDLKHLITKFKELKDQATTKFQTMQAEIDDLQARVTVLESQ